MHAPPPKRTAQVLQHGGAISDAHRQQQQLQVRTNQLAASMRHRGKSAEQQVIAGSGRPAAPPGYHYMSTGMMMKDPD